MSTHHTNLETLEDKDKDSQKMRRIEPEGTSIDSSSSSKENRNDDISIGPNGSSRQIDAPRKSERIAKHKNSASGGDQALCIAAPKGKGGKIEPSTKSKIILFSSIAAPKAHAANPPPKTKTKATSKLKRNTTKKRKTVAPEPEATPAIEEILPFLEERRHLYDAVEYFKDRLERIHISLDKEADVDSASRSVSHDIMLMKAFENEMENLVEYEFPMVLKGLRGLAQAVMGHPDSEEPRLEENDAGDGQLEEESGKTESREPVNKTLTPTLYKKRPRGDDDNGAEEEERYLPRQKVAPQNESGKGATPSSTSRKRQREAEVNDNDYRHSKRSQRFWKGKGKATATHASNVNSPLRLVRPLTGFDTLEDATTTDIDEDEEDKRSKSISRGSDPLPSRTRPTQPTAGPSGSRSPGPSTSHPPDCPVINIHRA